MDWQFVAVSAVRILLGFFALVVQFRIFRTSRSGVIRNVDSAILLGLAVVHSLLWMANFGFPETAVFFFNAVFLLVAFWAGTRLLWSAYAKYLFSVGAFFLVSGKFSGFLLVAVFLIFLGFLISASFFYLRTLFGWGLAGFLKKHFEEGGLWRFPSLGNVWDSVPHVFLFLVMIAISRAAHGAFSGHPFFSSISSTDAVILLSLLGIGVSWGIFTLKKKFVTDFRAKILTLALFVSIVGWSVLDWQGEAHFLGSLGTAGIFYVAVWTIRKAFSFYAHSDGAVFLDYRTISPGEIVDTKFLSRMLYDYQYDPVRRADLVKSAQRPVNADWIRNFTSYVDEAEKSAKTRALNGFVARTEVLVHRKVTVVPYVAIAFLASYVSLPETAIHAIAIFSR